MQKRSIYVLALTLSAMSVAGGLLRAPAYAILHEATCPIPSGAIKVPVPGVEQPDPYSCGAAAVMSVCSFFGVGPKDIETFKKKLHTTEQEGTPYRKIIAYSRKLGLHVEWKAGMTLDELDEHLKRGRPVICSIQAYADPPVDPAEYEKPDHNSDGHDVVAIGFDANNYYFMDPSLSDRRGCLSRCAFDKRWHDNEGTEKKPKVIRHLGIAIWPGTKGTPFLTEAKPIE
jgi:predicted double-glycine peptidase